jgi:hypothetical protein
MTGGKKERPLKVSIMILLTFARNREEKCQVKDLTLPPIA